MQQLIQLNEKQADKLQRLEAEGLANQATSSQLEVSKWLIFISSLIFQYFMYVI